MTKEKQESQAVFEKEFEAVKEIKCAEIQEFEDVHSMKVQEWDEKLSSIKAAIDAKQDYVAELLELVKPRSMAEDGMAVAGSSSVISSLTNQDIPSQFADAESSPPPKGKADRKTDRKIDTTIDSKLFGVEWNCISVNPGEQKRPSNDTDFDTLHRRLVPYLLLATIATGFILIDLRLFVCLFPLFFFFLIDMIF